MDGNVMTVVGTSGTNSWTTSWTCACGQVVWLGQPHACTNSATWQTPQQRPHRCPVCEGRGKVLFDPEAPYAARSNVQDFVCKPCSGIGIVWGF